MLLWRPLTVAVVVPSSIRSENDTGDTIKKVDTAVAEHGIHCSVHPFSALKLVVLTAADVVMAAEHSDRILE